jgi:uncharacterized phiE125 gp8 family phage protein
MANLFSVAPLGSALRRDILWEDVLVEPPAVEPVTLATVRAQRRLTTTSLDDRLDSWRRAARQQFEEETGLQLITATRDCVLERFPVQAAITVGRAPVQAILSVTYLDTANVLHTLDPAVYELFPPAPAAEESPPSSRFYGPYATPGGIQLIGTATWPTAADRAGAVRIRYRAGFGDTPETVPAILSYAILQYVGDFHRWSENQTEESRISAPLPLGTAMVRQHAAGMMRSARRLTRW